MNKGPKTLQRGGCAPHFFWHFCALFVYGPICGNKWAKKAHQNVASRVLKIITNVCWTPPQNDII